MSDTPESDLIFQSLLYARAEKRDYELRQHARRLELERDELKKQLDAQELELFAINSQLSEATEEIEEIQEQLNAYIMLDKMAMRKFMRELEEESQNKCR